MDWAGNSASFGIFNGVSRGKTGGGKESEGHKRQTYKKIRQDERIPTRSLLFNFSQKIVKSPKKRGSILRFKRFYLGWSIVYTLRKSLENRHFAKITNHIMRNR